jgi:hypothetical protein
MPSMAYRFDGWYRPPTEHSVPIVIHSIAGLPKGDRAFMVFAGVDETGEKWFLHWYRDGRMMIEPKPFRTPEDGLAHLNTI